jgi:hypothetical protein
MYISKNSIFFGLLAGMMSLISTVSAYAMTCTCHMQFYDDGYDEKSSLQVTTSGQNYTLTESSGGPSLSGTYSGPLNRCNTDAPKLLKKVVLNGLSEFNYVLWCRSSR